MVNKSLLNSIIIIKLHSVSNIKFKAMDKEEKTPTGYNAVHDDQTESNCLNCGCEMEYLEMLCDDCKNKVLYTTEDFSVFGVETRDNRVLLQHKSGEYLELFQSDGSLNQVYTILPQPTQDDLHQLHHIFFYLKNELQFSL